MFISNREFENEEPKYTENNIGTERTKVLCETLKENTSLEIFYLWSVEDEKRRENERKNG